MFEALLPVGDSTAILFSQPGLVMLLSALVLRDRCGLHKTVSALALLAGVTLIAQPSFIFPHHQEDTDYSAVGELCRVNTSQES